MPPSEAAYAKVERRAYNEATTRQAFILPLFDALETESIGCCMMHIQCSFGKYNLGVAIVCTLQLKA